MTRPDDSTLSPQDLEAIEKRARLILDECDGWQRFPVPIEDILTAANLQLAPTSAFNSFAILAYIKGKAIITKEKVKAALSKVFGIYDAEEAIIHIDTSVVLSKQNFLKLHETGHHRIPTHRKMFKLFQDCKETLSHEIADQFEREANNFARYVLFKGQTFSGMAADSELGIKIPMKLAKIFGASIYAACREYARTNHRDCLVYILEQPTFSQNLQSFAEVRRIEASPSFARRFGVPQETLLTPEHTLWPVLPVRRMTPPRQFSIKDLNGETHECLAEGFNTTFNIIILVYPVRALNFKSISLPG